MARTAVREATREDDAAQPVARSRRDQILDVTFRLIASEGLEGLRFSAVAAKVGINNATLCYYFPTREELIRALTERLMLQLKTGGAAGERAKNAGVNAGTNAGVGAVTELRRFFADLTRRVIEDPAFFIVMTELALRAQRDQKIAEIDAQRDNFWQRRIVGMLERGVAEGAFRRKLDCETVALAIMVQCKGVAQHAAMGRRKAKELTALVEEIARQVEMRVVREMADDTKKHR